MTFEKVDCRIYGAYDVWVAEPGAPCRPWICAIRAIPMIEVGRYAEVSCSGNPLGHLFHEFVDSVLVLDKDDGVERSAVIGCADIKIHRAAIDFDLLTV